MSTGSIVGLELRCLATLINSIIDLGVEYRELTSIRTQDGKIHQVDLVVKDENGKDIGFKKEKNGEYNIIADTSGLNSSQLKRQEEFIKKIRQKYAYKKVITELKNQGYVIAEEQKVQNNTIRLVARKWS